MGHATAPLILAVASSAVGSLQFGYQLGVLNPSLSAIVALYHLNNKSVVMTAFVVAAAVGGFTAGPVADKYGLRRSQMVSSILFLFGGLVSAFTPGGYSGLLAGRMLTGLATGATSLLSPRHMSEVAPPATRGQITSQNQVFITLGILLAFAAGIPSEYGVNSVHLLGTELEWWRIPLLFGTLLSILQFGLVCIAAESPVWLMDQGHCGAANKLFADLWGHDAADIGGTQFVVEAGRPPSDQAEPLLPSTEGEMHTSHFASLLQPRYTLILALALGLPLFQQLGGINIVIFYSADILAHCGISSPVLCTVLIGGTNFAVSLASSSLTDVWGRKALWVTSHAICGVSLLVLSITIMVAGITGAAPVCMACILLFMVGFAVGAGSIPWVYLTEILPCDIKGPAAAIATALNWAGCIFITALFPLSADGLGLGPTFFAVAVVNLVAALFGIRYMVETRRRDFQSIYDSLLIKG